MSKKIFVDTNIFLRFLIGDNEEQYRKCRRFFEKVKKGEVHAITSPLVIFEIIWVLHSYYELSKEEAAERVIALLGLRGLEVQEKDKFLEALVLWQETKADFNDVFNYVWCRDNGIKKIVSYDKHFDKFPEIQRFEP
jgi:predicted nucleic-acid-binding protein